MAKNDIAIVVLTLGLTITVSVSVIAVLMYLLVRKPEEVVTRIPTVGVEPTPTEPFPVVSPITGEYPYLPVPEEPTTPPGVTEVCINELCQPVGVNLTNIATMREDRPRTPSIINYTLTTAGTWYSISLPQNTKTWTLKSRGIHEIYYSFDPSHSTYMTLQKEQILTEDTTLDELPDTAIQVMSMDMNTIVEIETWSY